MVEYIRKYWYKWTHPVICEVRTLHRVTEKHSKNPELRRYEVNPSVLESLILEYRQKGYHFISIDDAVKLIQKHYRFPYFYHKNVVFTLDDGYADNYEYAYPIFKKYSVPFCIYVCKQYVTGEKPAGDGENYKMLSIEQLKLISKDSLCTIGCHTLSHPHLAGLSYEAQKREIEESKKWLEEELGFSIQHFAYPYGDYNKDTISIVKQVEFASAVSVIKRKVRANEYNSYLYKIPRITVVS